MFPTIILKQMTPMKIYYPCVQPAQNLHANNPALIFLMPSPLWQWANNDCWNTSSAVLQLQSLRSISIYRSASLFYEPTYIHSDAYLYRRPLPHWRGDGSVVIIQELPTAYLIVMDFRGLYTQVLLCISLSPSLQSVFYESTWGLVAFRPPSPLSLHLWGSIM